MAKIFLVGTSYSEHKGSAAVLMASISSLKESIPRSQFLVCSTTPRLDQQKLRLPDIYVIPCNLKNSTLELLLGAIYLKLTKTPFSRLPITKYLNDAEIIVDISGDSYSSICGKAPIVSMGIRVISAKLLRKPIVFYCQSIGPFNGLIDTMFAKLFLNLVDLIIVREFITANYLQKLGVETYVCADQAFLLEPHSSSSTALHFSNNRPIIGVNLSQHIDSMYGYENSANKYRIIMSQFIDHLIERYNANVLIIPELRRQKPNSYDDYYVSKIIVNMLKHKEHVTVVENDCSPSELKAIVGYCDILISPRFHMVIFALSQSIPSISIAYSPKSYGIMDMLGQSEYVLNHEDLTLELLMEKVEKLWLNKDGVRQDIKIRLNETRTRARYAAKLVRILLETQKK